MADDERPGEWTISIPDGDGSKDRATVALVAERIESLKELTKGGFTDVQRQLDRLGGLPQQVVEIASDLDEHRKRLQRLEASDASKGEKLSQLLVARETELAVQKASMQSVQDANKAIDKATQSQIGRRGFTIGTIGVIVSLCGVIVSVLVAVGVI